MPLTHIASGDNPTGCLTFRFVSNSTGAAAGWRAVVECQAPCQSIVASVQSAVPVIDDNNVIKACEGQPVHMVGAATFSESSQGATYTWDMGNGETLTGQIIDYIYNEPGIYITYLVVSDPRNCRNTNMVRTVIQVSGDPEVTSTIPDTMCYNEEYTFDVEGLFEGGEAFEEYTIDCTPPVTGTTFLPDGDGDVYSTTLTLNCYGEDAVITDGSQLISICIDIEHSFAGDLDIRLISPDGSSIYLHEWGTPGYYLGQANDSGGIEPGTGETYCFTMDATTLLANGATIPGGTPQWDMIIPGDYLPVDDFDGLIGSPINGTWTLEITDQWQIDNGYIFGWSMELDPELLSEQFSFQPELTEIDWSDEEMVVSSSNDGKTVTVRPDIFGDVCFTGILKNDYGCSFEKTFCTTVNPPIITGEPRVVSNCADDEGNYTHDLTVVENDLANNPYYEFTYHETEEDAENGVNEIGNPESFTLNIDDGPQTIYVHIVDTRYDCDKVVPITVVTKSCALELEQLPDLIVCGEGDTGVFDFTPQTALVYNNNLGYTVTYHNTEDDAIAGTAEITGIDTYNGTDGEEIWVRVTSINSPQVYATTSFSLFVRPNPEINPLQQPLYGCEVSGTGGSGEFDLSLNIGNVTMNTPYTVVEYYATESEAELGDSSLALPTIYVGPSGTIYVRVINTQTGCYTVAPQELIVRPTPVANEIAPVVYCDANNDGFGTFNLASLVHEIAGNPVPTDIDVTFHHTESDALNFVNEIENITSY
ncbi:MAG TPA: PKD domain-containing protein, partial [Flavobacterium sp.]|nr:PKD domain-containing protein [Flavobacterium sp.]